MNMLRLYFNLHALEAGDSPFRYNDLALYSLSSASPCHVHPAIHDRHSGVAASGGAAALPNQYKTFLHRAKKDLIALALSVFARTRVVLFLLRYTPLTIPIPHMPYFDFVVVGCGGGPSETDLSAYVQPGVRLLTDTLNKFSSDIL